MRAVKTTFASCSRRPWKCHFPSPLGAGFHSDGFLSVHFGLKVYFISVYALLLVGLSRNCVTQPLANAGVVDVGYQMGLLPRLVEWEAPSSWAS